MANTKIQSEQIADLAIVTDRIAADAVTTAKIADNVALGGSPTTTTQSASDNSTKIATTAYVTSAISSLIDSAPSTLNTLNEIAAALNDDANFNTTVTNSIAAKLPLAGGTMTGALNMGTQNITNAGTIASGEITTTAPAFTYISNTDSNVGLLIRDETYVSDEADITASRLASGNSLTLGLAGQDGINYYVGGSNVASLNSSGNATFAGTISSGAITTNIASHGTLIDLQVGSASKGNIKTVDNDVVIHTTESGHSGLRLGNGYVAPTDNAGTVVNGTIDLGLDSYRFNTVKALSGNFTTTGTASLADGTNTLRLTREGGHAAGSLGTGITFAQRWYDQSTQNVRTGGIFGIKVNGSGGYGGGLAFYSQPNSANDMIRALLLDSSQNATFDGNVTIAFDSNNSGNRLRIADTEGTSAAVRTYSTADGTGLILNHYYAVAGSPYIRYSDFVSSMGDAAATNMRFLTKPHNGNPTVALTIDQSQNATFAGNIDLTNSGSGDARLTLKSTTAGDPTLHFDSAAANRNAIIIFKDQGSVVGGSIKYAHNGDRMDFQSGSSTGATLSILNNKVGIGTQNPTHAFHTSTGRISEERWLNSVSAYYISSGTLNRNITVDLNGCGEYYIKIVIVGLWPYTGTGFGTGIIEVTGYGTGNIHHVIRNQFYNNSPTSATVTSSNSDLNIAINYSNTYRWNASAKVIYGGNGMSMSVDGTNG